MKITVIKSENGLLAKTMKSDGSKEGSATMHRGKFSTGNIQSLKQLNDMIENNIASNMAILLGVNKENKGCIVANKTLGITVELNPNEHVISRTKEHFEFEDEAIILFDIDTDGGNNILCENYEKVLEKLYILDEQFKKAEVLIRPSSSSYIFKGNEQINGAGSYHVYVKCRNVKSGLENYINNLSDKAFEQNLGYFKVSKSGNILKRQFFDGAVFSPERIVFEAGMICEKPYSQNRPEAYFKEGEYIDCSIIQDIDEQVLNSNIELAKVKVIDESKKTREEYLKTEVDKLVKLGNTLESATLAVNSLIDKKVLPLDYQIILADNSTILAKDIYMNPEKYNGTHCCDPIEPEKGSSKAMIYSNEKTTGKPVIHSFAHGGINYTIDIDYKTINDIVNKTNEGVSYSEAFISRIKKLANLANLSDEERKNISKQLKAKGLVNSVDILKKTSEDLKIIGEMNGYKDFTPTGGIVPSIDNLKVLMGKSDLTYDYDVILKKLEVKHWSINDKAPNKEEAVISLIETLALKEGIRPTISNGLSALANSSNSNPLLNYIKLSHKKYLENEGTNYIKNLATIFNTSVDNENYVEALLRKWMIQCIASWDYERNYTCPTAKEKYESVLVLQGKQGVQKTKFFDGLLPRNQNKYIKTGAMLNPSDKDSLMQNTAYGIVELGELDSTFNKADIGALKAFLSNSYDEYRAPYGKTSSKHKRCTSFCGSVNESGFLRDPTGARRFWVIPVTKIDFEKFETLDKDLIWGQAYDLYINAEKWWFDEDDAEINEEILKQHKEHESFSLAKDMLSIVEGNNCSQDTLRVTEIFERFTTTKPTKTDLNELSQLLKDAGYKKNSRKKFIINTEYLEPNSAIAEVVNANFGFNDDVA